MRIRVKAMIGGREPMGLKGRLTAWLTERKARTMAEEWVKTASMTPSQVRAYVTEGQLRLCRRRQWLNILLCYLSGLASVCFFHAGNARTDTGLVKIALCAGVAFFFSRFWHHVRTTLALQKQERQLIVESVHDH